HPFRPVPDVVRLSPMSSETRARANAFGLMWIGAIVLFGGSACNGHAGSSGSGASASASAAPGLSAPAPPPAASSLPPQPTAPAPAGSAGDVPVDVTSHIATPAPLLKEAVTRLTRKISEYGGHLGVAVLDVQSGELLAAQNDRRPLNPASNAKLFTA